MTKGIISLVTLISALCWSQTTLRDSLLVEIHVAIDEHRTDILECGGEIRTIAEALVKSSGFEWDIAFAVGEAAQDSYDYLSWASDLIAIYCMIQDRSERNSIAGYLNLSKNQLVERLEFIIEKINGDLAFSDNQHLIIQGNKLKEKIKEARNELDSFEFQ